jgi:hypothetical protein
MKDLGRDARQLLDTARRADSAPAAHAPHGRERLLATLAAGAATTAALGAKGALLGASGAATSASPAAGTAASLVTTLVSALTIGLSTGLIAVSPTARTPDSPRFERRAGSGDASANMAPRAQVGSKPSRAIPASSQPMPALAASSPVNKQTEAPPAVVAQTEAPAAVVAPTEAPAAVVASSKPTRASIAQETALLAEVQRALKSGRAMLALEALDRYAEQCPLGLLQEEATVSRVLALCALGRTQDARRWADEFLRRYPTSPLLPRVRNACALSIQRPADAMPSND